MFLSQTKWQWEDLVIFELFVCVVSWCLTIVGLVAPLAAIRVPGSMHSVSLDAIFFAASSIVPGLVAFLLVKESRLHVFKFAAQLRIYALAALIGFGLPFLAHFGSKDPYPFLGPDARRTLIRVFAINLLLAPLWEETLWRGYLYPKVVLMMPQRTSILVSSLAWVVWHVGFLCVLYKNGFPISLVLLLPVQYFFLGIILNVIFVMGRRTLAPCVLLHAGFNAAVAAYYGFYDRALNLNLYLSETLAMAIIAAVLFAFIKSENVETAG